MPVARMPRRLTLAAAAALAACLVGAPAASARETSCFWLGPISVKKRSAAPERFDGRNFNFPEESATYWIARYRLRPGERLVLKGRYPHARYESLNSYTQAGTPVFSLPDTRISPDPGATNPFRAGARRDRRRRGWTVTVLDESQPAGGGPRNTMYAPSTSTFASELVLRVYEPDRGRDLTGGVGLPLPRVIDPAGRTVASGGGVCAAINAPDRTIERTVQRIPAGLWQGLTTIAGPTSRPAVSPAFDPPLWERFFTQEFAKLAFDLHAGAITGAQRKAAPQEDRGGFYSNRDSRYLLTHLSGRLGKVALIRGRMPVYPATRDGARRMPPHQVRFWSLCSNESRVTLRATDCLADRQVPLRRGRAFTIAVSIRADRPRNARAACGIAWLETPRRGDAAGRGDYAILILRNMLPNPGWRQAIHRVRRYGDERRVTGPYFPRTKYATRAAVERLGCRRARG